jgi:HK97 family phage portal protein
MSQLSLGNRLSVAAKALVGIFNDESARQAHGLLGGIFGSQGGDPPYRGDTNILKAYSTMPWLRAVAQRVATAVSASSTQWILYAPASGKRRDVRLIQRAADDETRKKLIRKGQQSEDLVPVDDHILLDALNKANSYMVGQSLFKVTQIHLDLVGESFWIKERNGLGAPVEFWPIPPDWVQSTPTPDKRSFRVSFNGWQGEIPDTEVLWMAELDPANPYTRGSGLARSLNDELETDEYAAKHTRQLFFNRARPDMIIWPKQQGAHDIGLQQDQVRRLEERWLDGHQGFWRAFKPFFVGREINVHEVNQSLQELQLVELRKHERDTIVQVFGIPPELLGILNNSNRATIESADYLFSRWVVTPRMEFLRSQLQERLIPEYDDRLVLDFVSPVAEDREHMLEASKAAPWSLKVDEWRVLQGQEPLDDNAGQIHMMPLNLVPVTTPSVPPAPMPGTVAGDAPPIEDEYDTVVDSLQQDLAIMKQAKDSKEVDFIIKEIADDLDELPDIWRVLAKREPRIARKIQRRLIDLSDRVIEDKLADISTAPQLEEMIHFDDWLKELSDEMNDIWIKAWWVGAEFAAYDSDIPLEKSGNGITRVIKQDDDLTPAQIEVEARVQFNVANPLAVEWAKVHGSEFISEIGLATRKAIRSSIASALQQGLSVNQEARRLLKLEIGLTEQQAKAVKNYNKRLKDRFPDMAYAERLAKVDRYRKAKQKLRAMTIARTELSLASSAGQEGLWTQAAKQNLLATNQLKRKWLSTMDLRRCEICKGLGRLKAIPFDKTFEYAGRVYKNAPAHPNCRCTVGLVDR